MDGEQRCEGYLARRLLGAKAIWREGYLACVPAGIFDGAPYGAARRRVERDRAGGGLAPGRRSRVRPGDHARQPAHFEAALLASGVGNAGEQRSSGAVEDQDEVLLISLHDAQCVVILRADQEIDYKWRVDGCARIAHGLRMDCMWVGGNVAIDALSVRSCWARSGADGTPRQSATG